MFNLRRLNDFDLQLTFADGSWKSPSNYKIRLYEADYDDVYFFRVNDGKLSLMLNGDLQTDADYSLGFCGDIDKESFEDILKCLHRNSWHKPNKTASTITSWQPDRHYITLSFDNNFTFSIGDVEGKLFILTSQRPPKPIETNQERNRRRLLNDNANHFRLKEWVSRAIRGVPPDVSVHYTYLTDQGIDVEFLSNNGLLDLFNDLVAQEIADRFESEELEAQNLAHGIDEREAQNHTHEITGFEREMEAQSLECSICCNTTERQLALVPCGHHPFCSSCIEKLDKCPFCRVDIVQRITLFDV